MKYRSALPALALVLAMGCAPGNPGLVLERVIVPDDMCVYEINNPGLVSGRFDIGLGDEQIGVARPGSYRMAAVFVNQLLNLGRTGTMGPPMADPNVIQLEEAEVELRSLDGTPLALGGPNPYLVPASGFIQSADGMTVGQGVGIIEIIPPVVGLQFGDAVAPGDRLTILAAIRVTGRTAGDAAVMTQEFVWAIEVCNGCLVACVFDEEGAAQCNPSCTPGQDGLHITPMVCGIDAICTR